MPIRARYIQPQLPTPLPAQTFFRCLDDSAPAGECVGDWPVQGRVYAGRLLTCPVCREPRVFLDGFWAPGPGGGLAVERFVQLTRVWLN